MLGSRGGGGDRAWAGRKPRAATGARASLGSTEQQPGPGFRLPPTGAGTVPPPGRSSGGSTSSSAGVGFTAAPSVRSAPSPFRPSFPAHPDRAAGARRNAARKGAGPGVRRTGGRGLARPGLDRRAERPLQFSERDKGPI